MTLSMDGRPITVSGPMTLLEAARASGIAIPSLCDHPALAPYAACRICLVEVKGRKGYLPACSTAAEEGMEVVTASPEILALRRGILELILAEHPHACLICAEKASCDELKSTIRKTDEVTGCVLCPANGRCELQRVVEAVGLERVPYPFLRRGGRVRRDDPFIDRDNSLCILCGRCVRVCGEIRGASVLTFVSRGSDTVIGTALDRRLLDAGCQFCGACVDVCPTGSFSERATRYDRPAESESKALCTLCGQGCGLLAQVRNGRVSRTVPDPDGPVNRGQACVRGRFLVRYALAHPKRIERPLIRENGSLRPADWEEALALAAGRLADLGTSRTAVTGSVQSSCEDLFALHRLAAEVLRVPAVDGPWTDSAAAGLRRLEGPKGRRPPLNVLISDIARAASIVVIGEDLRITQPIVGLAVRRAAAAGAAVMTVAADGWRRIARDLGEARPTLVLFGPSLVEGRQGPARLAELRELVEPGGGRLIALDRDGNVRGALAVAGAFAPGPALTRPRALLLAGPPRKPGLRDVELTICLASYEDERTAVSDIVFPEALPFETEGTFVNIEGRIQISPAIVAPMGEARPGWRILADLAAGLGGPEFGFESAAAVRAALGRAVPSFAGAGDSESAFLAEDGGLGPAPARAAGPAPAAPDTWHGLRLAEEHKGLKLLRGR